MANIVYPNKDDFHLFIDIIIKGKYTIKKYIPCVSDEWYAIIVDSVDYVKHTSVYEENLNIYDVASKILYKIAKRHELGDGNKRSSVIAVVLFCLVNDYYVTNPQSLKELAKSIAKTKGRKNEDFKRKKIAESLKQIIVKV